MPPRFQSLKLLRIRRVDPVFMELTREIAQRHKPVFSQFAAADVDALSEISQSTRITKYFASGGYDRATTHPSRRTEAILGIGRRPFVGNQGACGDAESTLWDQFLDPWQLSQNVDIEMNEL